ncbi:hypothetical protein [Paenibacillus glacialis]|uniref:Uncharacterized protein n=1 Tax=Paenibacillus glacialis TaxID=494026 RepID=A0A168HQH5_9BACL|nr:hypothetical protein [Paenibacillus glacialis]OAB38426.1 hypothetical protein PGLA_20250 [Paenibacillus glacialis]
MLNAESALDKAIVKQATQVGVDYYHEQYDTDVVFTSHKIIPSNIASAVFLHGHVEGEKNNLIFISMDYINYKINSFKRPDGFK